MHIPDGYLDPRTCLGTCCLAAAGLGWASRAVTARWSDRTVPLLGVMSAFVFAGQMVNFPVVGGTSGHLMGGVLAAVLLGPAAASMALTTVLTVQCLLFQDGGITALGANVLNLGLVGVLGGYGVYRALEFMVPSRRHLALRAAAAAWASVVISASACASELALAGTVPLRLGLPAMALTHAAIGVGEAIITSAVVAFVLQVRPDLLYEPQADGGRSPSLRWVAVGGLLLSLGVVLLLSPLGVELPDGLEHLAAQLGLAAKARPIGAAPLAGYALPGFPASNLASALTGLAGTLACFGLAWVLAKGVARRLRRSRSGT